jgi:hypothetical protein
MPNPPPLYFIEEYMKLSPIKDIEVPYFDKLGRKAGTILLERGFENEITILRKSNGTMDVILEDEGLECRFIPAKYIHLY